MSWVQWRLCGLKWSQGCGHRFASPKTGQFSDPFRWGFSGKQHVELARIEGYVFFLCNAFGGWEGSMVRYSPWTNNLTRTPHKNSWPLVTPQLYNNFAETMCFQHFIKQSSTRALPWIVPPLDRTQPFGITFASSFASQRSARARRFHPSWEFQWKHSSNAALKIESNSFLNDSTFNDSKSVRKAWKA